MNSYDKTKKIYPKPDLQIDTKRSISGANNKNIFANANKRKSSTSSSASNNNQNNFANGLSQSPTAGSLRKIKK